MSNERGLFKQEGSQYWWIRYAGADGRIIRESTKTTKKKEALAILEERRTQARKGILPEPVKKIPNITFRELAEEYLKFCKSQRSFNSKVYLVRDLVEVFGNLPVRSFTTKVVEQFQSGLLETGKKPATINRYLAILKHCIHKGYQWELAPEDIFKKISRVKLLPENNKRLRYLSTEEIDKLIQACSPHLKPIVITALNTGMRKGEILSLKWEQVDLKHGFILLDKTKNGDRREIPTNQTLRDTLLALPRRIDIPYVFYDPETGKPYQNVKRSFATACKRAGIRDFHFHDLRHTFASHLVMAGVDLTTVSRLLGHKSITMTLRYSHLAPEHMSRAVDILDSHINKKSTAYLLHSLAGK